MFEVLEASKAKLDLDEYSISQNTLDDLFHAISQETLANIVTDSS